MEPYNCSVDYWSLGVVGFELFVGEPPYENPSDEELYYMICNSTNLVPGAPGSPVADPSPCSMFNYRVPIPFL